MTAGVGIQRACRKEGDGGRPATGYSVSGPWALRVTGPLELGRPRWRDRGITPGRICLLAPYTKGPVPCSPARRIYRGWERPIVRDQQVVVSRIPAILVQASQ